MCRRGNQRQPGGTSCNSGRPIAAVFWICRPRSPEMIGKLRLERRDERVSEREAEDGEGPCVVFEVRRDRLGNDPREPMYCATGLSVANLAMHPCSAVRTGAGSCRRWRSTPPSPARTRPGRWDGGGSGLNWEALDIVQGVTAAQERKGLAPGRGSGLPRPKAGGRCVRQLALDPSFSRSATICAATSSPRARPLSLFFPSGTGASDSASAASSCGWLAGNRRTRTPVRR